MAGLRPYQQKAKDKTENILTAIAKNKPYVEVITSLVKNTRIKIDGKKAMDIFYRAKELRINIPSTGGMYEKYIDLLMKNLVYQKDGADPESTKNEYAFFVSLENAEKVLDYLTDK